MTTPISKHLSWFGNVRLNWFSRQDRLGWKLVVFLSLFVWGVFSLRDGMILLMGDWPHLYGAVGVPKMRWEEVVCYLPFAKAFTMSTLLPIAPAVEPRLSGFSFFPVISMGLFQLLFAMVGKNLDGYLCLSHGLWPVVNFWLIYLIFRVYIHKSWALLLAFLGVGYFSNFSSFDYLVNLLQGEGTLLGLMSLDPPEITRVPFPGISLTFFAGILYLTLQNNRLNFARIVWLSVLWGLQIYVYAFNFIAGIMFWYIWLLYACYVTKKQWNTLYLIKVLALATIIILIVTVPYMLKCFLFQSSIEQQFVDRLNWVSQYTKGGYFSGWGIMLAYLFPLGFVILTIYLFRGDYYELFYKFTPIFIAMVVDLMVGSMHLILGQMIDPRLYQDRISGILFRFFYFIPLLYFLGVPYKVPFPRQHERWYWLRQFLHLVLQRILIHRRVLICSLGILLISIIESLGSIKYWQNHQTQVAPFMKTVEQEIEIVRQYGNQKGIIVYETIASNLMIPLLTEGTTLLVNSYGNYVEEEEILDRLVLYAKLFNWSEEQFLQFMKPSSFYQSSYQGPQFVLDEERLKIGLGFWFLHHQKKMTDAELRIYIRQITAHFREVDVSQMLSKYPIATIVARSPIASTVSGIRIERVGQYYLSIFST